MELRSGQFRCTNSMVHMRPLFRTTKPCLHVLLVHWPANTIPLINRTILYNSSSTTNHPCT